jgi:hypothetical protein
MSIQQAALDSMYRVVGTRTTGERVMMTERVDLPVAEKILSLLEGSTNYTEIFIECNGERLPHHCHV